ncbi:unnamed protein product, partial [Allacma fusca]
MSITVAVGQLLFSSDDEGEYGGEKEYRPRINFEAMNTFCFKEKFRISSTDAEFVLEKIGRYLKHRTTKNHALTPH